MYVVFFSYYRHCQRSQKGPGLIQYLLGFLLGYGFGSIPTAYLLVHLKADLDIRTAGTGNVGGMNAYEVTNSLATGAAVVVLDAAKGALAVGASTWCFGPEYLMMGITGLSAVIGHIFSIWIGFRGGRGLATAGGVLAWLGWSVIVSWAVVWAVTYALSRRLYLANIIATIICPVVVVLFPDIFGSHLTAGQSYATFEGIIIVLSIILLIGHAGPLWDFVRSHHNMGNRL